MGFTIVGPTTGSGSTTGSDFLTGSGSLGMTGAGLGITLTIFFCRGFGFSTTLPDMDSSLKSSESGLPAFGRPLFTSLAVATRRI